MSNKISIPNQSSVSSLQNNKKQKSSNHSSGQGAVPEVNQNTQLLLVDDRNANRIKRFNSEELR